MNDILTWFGIIQKEQKDERNLSLEKLNMSEAYVKKERDSNRNGRNPKRNVGHMWPDSNMNIHWKLIVKKVENSNVPMVTTAITRQTLLKLFKFNGLTLSVK